MNRKIIYHKNFSDLINKDMLRFLKKHSGKRVLEIGCGNGETTIILRKGGFRVTAVDIDRKFIVLAKNKADKLHLKIDFRVMNAEKMKLASKGFDAVVGKGILHHLDPKKAIPEIKKVLKPKGKIFFMEPLGHNPLINLFRRLTPHQRVSSEKPLKIAELGLLKKNFRVQLNYLMFLALFSYFFLPFYKSKFFAKIFLSSNVLDQKLAKIFGLQKYFWIVIIKGTNG